MRKLAMFPLGFSCGFGIALATDAGYGFGKAAYKRHATERKFRRVPWVSYHNNVGAKTYNEIELSELKNSSLNGFSQDIVLHYHGCSVPIPQKCVSLLVDVVATLDSNEYIPSGGPLRRTIRKTKTSNEEGIRFIKYMLEQKVEIMERKADETNESITDYNRRDAIIRTIKNMLDKPSVFTPGNPKGQDFKICSALSDNTCLHVDGNKRLKCVRTVNGIERQATTIYFK